MLYVKYYLDTTVDSAYSKTFYGFLMLVKCSYILMIVWHIGTFFVLAVLFY